MKIRMYLVHFGNGQPVAPRFYFIHSKLVESNTITKDKLFEKSIRQAETKLNCTRKEIKISRLSKSTPIHFDDAKQFKLFICVGLLYVNLPNNRKLKTYIHSLEYLM